MVLGLLKHIYQYFAPPTADSDTPGSPDPGKNLNPDLRKFEEFSQSLEDYIPVLGNDGQVTALISRARVLALPQAFNPTLNVPVAAFPSMSAKPISSSVTHPRASRTPAVQTNKKEIATSREKDSEWDGWPNGVMERYFSWKEFEDTDQLLSHWAAKVGGGDRRGDASAGMWERGKRSTRDCLGIIRCVNEDCDYAVRPFTTRQRIIRQLEKRCEICSASLIHQECEIRAVLWKWSGGVHYEQNGSHDHDRPPRILHLSKSEHQKFVQLVEHHPKTGPRGLVVGVPGLGGPGQSAAEISPALLNIDRVAKERQKVRREHDSTNSDDFIASFAKFTTEHPDFVLSENIGSITVVALQSPFMASQLVREEKLDLPINGLVNDAAHGWWKERNHLLMITSVYSPELSCWVPGLMSFTNGASADHFKWHFLALFESIAEEVGWRKMTINDDLFAGVMDFSEAERGGFIEAFISFWNRRQENERTDSQLRHDAGRILKGCKEHFRSGVTRISRIGGVIPVEQRGSFIEQAIGLLSCPTDTDFRKQAGEIIQNFPKTASWLEWWLRPAHASILFESQRVMDIAIWDSIPDTTNAEEAMHWKLYAAAGKNHTFFEGLRSLRAVSQHYEKLYDARLKGVPIRYGQAERWKSVRERIGRTKPSRAPNVTAKKRKQNDGRPPDTVKELLQKSPSKKSQKQVAKLKEHLQVVMSAPENVPRPEASVVPIGPSPPPSQTPVTSIQQSNMQPCYPWENNSCWLDASLQLLFVALSRNFIEFSSLALTIHPEHPLRTLLDMFQHRLNLNLTPNEPNCTQILKKQRNNLRQLLIEHRQAEHPTSFEPLMTWFYGLLRNVLQHTNDDYGFSAYFEFLTVEVHSCTGSPRNGPHIEVQSPPRRASYHQVSTTEQYMYDGSIRHWFEDFTSIKTSYTSRDACWEVKDGIPLCPGKRQDSPCLVISIPVLLIIEAPDDSDSGNSLSKFKDLPPWDFPPTLTPTTITKTEAKRNGITYDLVGLGFFSKASSHFIARYADKESSQIYTYDSMKNNGNAISDSEPDAELATHIQVANRLQANKNIPPTYVPSLAIYHLRGGANAQKAFYQSQTEACSKIFKLKFSTAELSILPDVTYCGQDCPILLDPGPRQKKRGMKEYVSKKHSDIESSKSLLPTLADNKFVSSGPSPLPILLFDGPESEEETIRSHTHGKPALKIDTQTEITHPTALESPPDSPFNINCRCGLNGDGNVYYDEREGEAVLCTECEHWSHIACQRNGRASKLRAKEAFYCDFCQVRAPGMGKSKKDHAAERRELESRTKRKIPLKDRLLPGRGALARYGDFWYPVRLIQNIKQSKKWRIRWWRVCIFDKVGIEPGSLMLIDEKDVVDSLWGMAKARRQVRLGKWIHAHNVTNLEDILSNPASISYTLEVDEALQPYVDSLQELLRNPELADVRSVPAVEFLNKRDPLRTLIPCTGNLSVVERAQIANWFETHIAIDKNLRHTWLGLLPLAHTFTLFIGSQLLQKPPRKTDMSKLSHQEVLEMAWEIQANGDVKLLWQEVDVERECLAKLEEEMFERSRAAGIAGEYQWGLDTGDHQEVWNPYEGLPEHWIHTDRLEIDDYDEKLQPGPHFIKITKLTKPVISESDPKPRPKPRRPRKA